MQCVKNDLSENLEYINIEIFSDLHLGSKKCDYKGIIEKRDRVLNDPNTYCIILGDVCNNSTKDSVGDCFEEPLSPMEQVKKGIQIFEPIKDKILGITSGNHERRSYKKEGVDLLWFLASELGCIDKYDYAACLLFVRFGKSIRTSSANRKRKMCYTIYMSHGDGVGGRTAGGKANGLQRRGQIVNADIVCIGHTHMPLSFKDCAFEIDYRNSTITKKEQLYVNASAELDYEQYAELYGMRPSSKSSPVIKLDGHHKNFICTL